MTSASRIAIEATVVPTVSYPMAHNRIAVLGPVRIGGDGSARSGALVTVTLQDAVGVLGTGAALVDLPERGSTVLSTPPSPLDPIAMARVEEQRPGRVTVAVSVADQVVAQRSWEVTILAAQQWMASPPMLGLEMLAAFVMPNHPAIGALVREASGRLAVSTGSGSVQGYQAGPDRVDSIAEAIFETFQAVGVRYAEPPASWADIGQKVRTPDEVLTGRMGTCLDTSLVFAAALEQAGLHPLVWVVPGHAFVGYWRDQRSLQATATTELDGLVNLVDLDVMRLVETTLATEGPDLVTMADATAAAVGTLRSAVSRAVAMPSAGSGPDKPPDVLDATTGVVDIRAARRDLILPVPARVTQPDGAVTLVTYRPPAAAGAPPSDPAAAVGPPAGVGARPAAAGSAPPGPPTRPARPQAPARIGSWKNALLDLSMRNRLLNYSPRSGVHLEVPPGMLAALEDIVMEGAAITVLPADQVGGVQEQRGVRLGRDLTEGQRADLIASRRSVYCDVPADAYDVRMRRLAYRVRTIAEETGANNLYLALGSLVWTLDDQRLRSPLVLVPVRLTTRARHGSYRIELDESGTSTPNYCLLEKLRQVHGLDVPGLAEPAVDSSGIDLDAAFRSVRTALADAGLGYRVEQTADLAVLAFAKFRLWKDLDDAWPEFLHSPLVAHLANTPTEGFVDPAATSAPAGPDLDDLATGCPVPADASQLDAVAAAVAGQTYVLEGPPGTGKSQTITNVLARAVASGQRVLFVAEKRAALDVVTRRLAAVGLRPYCLDLHDKGAKPAQVRAAVRAALDTHEQSDPQGLAAATERMRSAAGQLGRYAGRLHQPNGAGLSYYSAHTQTLTVGGAPSLPVPDSVVASGAGLAEVRRALVTLPDAADPARPRVEHAWGFVDPDDPAGADPDAIAAAAADLTTELSGWWTGSPVADPLLAARLPSELAALATFSGTWAQDLSLIDEAATQRWLTAARAAAAQVDGFVGDRHPGLELVRPEVFGLPLDEIDRDARAACASSWFGRKRRQLAVVERFDGVLREGATIPRKQIADFTGELIGGWKALVTLETQVAAVTGLLPPPGWNPLLTADRQWLDDRISWLSWAGATASLRDTSGRLIPAPEPFRVALRALLESRAVITDGLRESLGRLAAAATRLADLTGDAPFSAWSADGLAATWARTAAGRAAEPAELRRYLALLAHLQPLRSAGLEEARRELLTGRVAAADAVRALDSGVAASSTRERAAATGLAHFDPAVQATAVATFVASAERVRDQLDSAIPAGVSGARTFDAGSGYGRIGELTRELAKQRRGLAVRGLMSRYGDLITRVMPCTLVSPDSLARFFPPEHGLFDLVVFDEASQIRVADAIGALGRARAAVVVGDSKQMPPTSFAESTWAGPDVAASEGPDGDDLDDLGLTAVEDEESILAECVQSGLTRRWLSWHYRSQDETLIAFSNRRYYEDRLSSFPSPISGSADPSIDGHGVNLVRVAGEFLRSGPGKSLRTNPIEAIAVVTEIRNRFAAAPEETPSIGVVTFNAQQRTHIESVLRDLHDDRITEALDRTDGEGLFVKNLENVQGDERDVILFSTAFSANAHGVLPLNFGPLNQVGGERRLNVAITRARRQVIVFSSFDPEDLRAEETSSQGIKDLRGYLELARSGSGDSVGASPRAPAADRHRDEIAAALRDRGLSVATNVGLSDFTLDLAVGPADADQDRGRLGARAAVLLDGLSWAARRTVGDRDGLPVDVLSRLMGWPRVERVWLPEWLYDRAGVLDRLQAAATTPPAPAPVRTGLPVAPPPVLFPLDADDPERPAPAARPSRMGARSDQAPAWRSPSGPSDPDVAVGPADRDRNVPTPDGALPGEEPFTPWRSGYLGGREVLDGLPGPAAADRVRRALSAGIEAEGPVHIDRLARLVAGGFDLGRVTAERRAAILGCLPPDVLRDPADPVFAWPASVDPSSWTAFRRTGPTDDRTLEQVSPIEIGNAMAALCVAGAGMDRDQLFAQTLVIFGFRRRTAAQLALLDAALARSVAGGRLRTDGALVLTSDA